MIRHVVSSHIVFLLTALLSLAAITTTEAFVRSAVNSCTITVDKTSQKTRHPFPISTLAFRLRSSSLSNSEGNDEESESGGLTVEEVATIMMEEQLKKKNDNVPCPNCDKCDGSGR
mmetsp:Transcript_6291/g.13616  ORF Transcript_6291/g.13616 Transcript_6291/m.13616 type:complete len:116 (-) Transcript_6291:925-1272(-)|eukprot:CAMPEP_0113327452 /NCGR_PEP_ID=MMETSP0010_2-20120614/19304_1 /TAXON_ID=216773 ORGANISM="Corethron hystrix, Strain 308" /NCGR_SAMPLE_ID=MMETSP0010_2 /ASSEMBLY_ACC=CAM_ASM_000155 /LENGTH=115 /DNA_ID=CAMNT_0000188335 /DNA_START=75 /DNA_END=422 /DNA_ORIENTATION=- /assembly_acc=CAM_ASM_000155